MRLVADDVGYRYAGAERAVLAGLTCDIPAGTSAAILGPSGSGKTTLLTLLGGLLSPQSGSFTCVDEAGNDHVPRDVSTWVLQTVSLLPDRSVVDNAALGAYLDSCGVTEAKDRAMAALDDMGLGDRANDPARVLSGGEAQRVAIARALSSDRPVLFADEPTGQLDAATTDHVLELMLGNARRTVVLVTHDETAASRCDVVLRLHGGKLMPDPAGGQSQ